MNVHLNKTIIEKNGLSIGEVLLLIGINNEINIENSRETLIINGFISKKHTNTINGTEYFITNKAKDVLNTIFIESEKVKEDIPDKYLELAQKLKEIFPKGKKEGTQFYWTEGPTLIIRRLYLFFRKYGNIYSEDQILQAAKAYVTGFNGQYTYMQLLKYFIFKEKKGVSGEIEGESQLINYIDHEGEESTKNDWTSIIL
jgi:hypothetical protein